MKKFTLFLIIFLIGTFSVFAQSSKTKKKTTAKTKTSKNVKTQVKTENALPRRLGFSTTRNPSDDLKALIFMARQDNKRIILDVGGEWCSWCHEMDNFIIRNAALSKFIDENFIWWKVNFSEENKNEAFLANYPQIKGYPHLYVLEKDGTFLYSKDTSELEDGVKSYNLQKFTNFLTEYSLYKTAAK